MRGAFIDVVVIVLSLLLCEVVRKCWTMDCVDSDDNRLYRDADLGDCLQSGYNNHRTSCHVFVSRYKVK